MSSKTNKRHWIRLGLLLVCFFPGAIFVGVVAETAGVDQNGFRLAVVAYMLAWVILFFYAVTAKFRCPYCDHLLSRQGWLLHNALWAPKNCPKCNQELP